MAKGEVEILGIEIMRNSQGTLIAGLQLYQNPVAW
jgi:hypothetical protein